LSTTKAKKFVDPGITQRIIELVGDDKKAFADKTGISYEVIRLWCKGAYLPTVELLVKLRRKCGINIDWLLTGEGSAQFENNSECKLTDQAFLDKFSQQNYVEGGSSGTLADIIKMIPPKVVEVVRGDDEQLKELIINLIEHMTTKKKFIELADSYGVKKGAESDSKWQSQDEPRAVEDALDDVMNS